ncbi:MAG: type II toxin-antitoxin system HipA family toxin [Prosthecobacter sp.]
MTEELLALTQGRQMGRVIWDRKRDRLSFHYEDKWLTEPETHPLSLSMGLSFKSHDHAAVESFLWGLLPDNDGVLKRWGDRFHVSPRNAFKLLSHVGQECAGAVQFIRPEQADEWLIKSAKGRVQWLTQDDITERMRLLVKDHSASRTTADCGQFSLAGAQPKTAFHYDPKADRWGVPSGIVPTTHIFKPATGDFDGYAENEHFCLSLARELDLATANSVIRYFGDVPVIVVERYDRRRSGTKVERIHQEDMCQAMMRMPQIKYQNQGGPSAQEVIDLIRRHSTAREADAARFVEALVLNWLICGTDAHAKNYSFLIAQKGTVRLAPLYDLSSALPYPRQVDPRKAKLAMKVGEQYTLIRIGTREWKKSAEQMKIDPAWIGERIREFSERIPDAARRVAKEMKSHGLRHDVTKRLVDSLTERARCCGTAIAL